MNEPIENHGLIGNRRTAALVALNGSINWLCLPRFDSDAVFAALLGEPGNGRWLIGPEPAALEAGQVRTTRRQVDDALILETTHETPTGSVSVLDLMPSGEAGTHVIRRIRGIAGTVRLQHEWVVRFGYGDVVPWMHRDRDPHTGREVLVAVAGPDQVILRGPVLPQADRSRSLRRIGRRHTAVLEVSAGDILDFELCWLPSYREAPAPIDVDAAIRRDAQESEQWLAACNYRGPYVGAVRTSVLVLRALTHQDTGGIVAAPTTSLPEQLGGERNWDYRFTWLRDAAMTVQALLSVGLEERSTPWRDWLLRAVAGDPEDLQIMYTVDGARQLPERELPHLAGYDGSRPVRVGNGAVDQRQSDVLGEVLIALQRFRRLGIAETRSSWQLQRSLVQQLARTWRIPDNGLWEIRGSARRFTHSMVMVWAAFDTAVSAVVDDGQPVPKGVLEHWQDLREQARADVMRWGYNDTVQSFTQHDATTEVDASLLVMPLVGFITADDPRFATTVSRIEHDLMRDGLLLRYRTQSGVDGLAGDEHPFLICSFWLVSVYALQGRLDEAHALMRKLIGLSNDVGLLSEEYSPELHRQMGNFPQAFSHLGLVQAAVQLADADRRAATPPA